MNFFKSNEKVTIDSYPYGRLRCVATFGLEFNASKGYRTTFQTINPKTGRVNAIKKSTYAPVYIMYQNPDNNHVNYLGLDFYGDKGLNTAAAVISEKFELFTPAEIQYLYNEFHQRLKISCYGSVVYGGADKEAALNFYRPFVEICKQGLKDGLNNFAAIKIDLEAAKALDKPDYQPFVSTGMISLSDLANRPAASPTETNK